MWPEQQQGTGRDLGQDLICNQCTVVKESKRAPGSLDLSHLAGSTPL